MEVEVAETKTYLEISEVAGSQIAPSETNQVISPESETEVIVQVQEQAATSLEITESAPTTVEVIQQVISIVNPSLPPEDHGSLLGVLDDDHPQYVLATGARAMGELRLTPKASSTGPAGTIFYCNDKSVYVGVD